MLACLTILTAIFVGSLNALSNETGLTNLTLKSDTCLSASCLNGGYCSYFYNGCTCQTFYYGRRCQFFDTTGVIGIVFGFAVLVFYLIVGFCIWRRRRRVITGRILIFSESSPGGMYDSSSVVEYPKPFIVTNVQGPAPPYVSPRPTEFQNPCCDTDSNTRLEVIH